MDVIEHDLRITPDELQCLVCAMAGNFPERFNPIRMDLLRKLAKARHADAAGAVAAIDRALELLGRVGVGDKPMAARDGEDVQEAYRVLATVRGQS